MIINCIPETKSYLAKTFLDHQKSGYTPINIKRLIPLIVLLLWIHYHQERNILAKKAFIIVKIVDCSNIPSRLEIGFTKCARGNLTLTVNGRTAVVLIEYSPLYMYVYTNFPDNWQFCRTTPDYT